MSIIHLFAVSLRKRKATRLVGGMFAVLLFCWFAGLLVCWFAGLILNVDLVLINKVMKSHRQRLIRNWDMT